MTRPAPRELIVTGKRLITPNMLRVTLGGPELAGFPVRQEGGYVKLRLHPGPRTDKPVVRTYTIRSQREDAIDIDFVLHRDAHGHAGPATQWAFDAEEGTSISIGGPGPAKPLPVGRAHYLVVGDMTALPAISVNLAALPIDAQGVAIIEVQDDADKQTLACPGGIRIEWMVNPNPGRAPGQLVDGLVGQHWPGDDLYAWVACEFSSMRSLRRQLIEQRGLGRDRLYISSYWKAGSTEDDHRMAKRADAEVAGLID